MAENNQLRILNEKELSDIMNGFHNAVNPIGNCKILLRDSPWDTDPEEYFGGRDARDGMEKVCQYLESLFYSAKDETIFVNQFLKPVQIMAKFREHLSTREKASTDLEGWIFSISKPTKTSPFNKTENVTASIVFPKLRTTMSMSFPKEIIKNTSSSFSEFTKCQPTGLVNRIHPVKGSSISNTNKEVLLSQLNFLFTSFNDIQIVGKSIEMENFCEVQSQNSEIKQHMGFSFVSFGKVLDVQGSRVTIEAMNKSGIISFTINSRHYYKNSNMISPEKMKGKHVRFFGVAWYNPDTDGKVNLDTPEVFLMQEETDSARLKIEDEIGRIRIRNHVPQSEIKEELRGKIESEDCIENKNNSLYFVYPKTGDPMCDSFMNSTYQIKSLRDELKLGNPIIRQEQVLSSVKMGMTRMETNLKRSSPLLDVLTDYLWQNDLSGHYDKMLTVEKFAQIYSEKMINKKIWHLKFLGIFDHNNKKYETITANGMASVEKILHEKLSKNLTLMQDIIRLDNGVVPPSILLEYLRNSERFLPLVLNEDSSTETIWVKKNTKPVFAELQNEYNGNINSILEVMSNVSYSVTSQYISEEILQKEHKKMSVFAIETTLKERAEQTGSVSRDGDSWKYPVFSRLLDLFSIFPEKKFNLIEILNELNIPKSDRDKTIGYLREFEECNIITQLEGNTELEEKIKHASSKAHFGKQITSKKIRNVLSMEEKLDGQRYWMSLTNAKKTVLSELSENIQKSVVRIFDEMEETVEDKVSDRYFSKPMDLSMDILVNRVIDNTKEILKNDFLDSIQKLHINIEETVEDIIDKMIQDDTLSNIDGMISKKKNSF